MQKNLKTRVLVGSDFDDLDRWFGLRSGEFNKPRTLWAKYLKDVKTNKRLVLVAELNKKVVGYCTLNFKSSYAPFKKAGIPEIQDLNVGRPFRRQGIAGALIASLERQVKKMGKGVIGIGVGMEPGYGNAQRLYVKMGYIPDGRGLTYNHIQVTYGKHYPADDELVLFFTKEL